MTFDKDDLARISTSGSEVPPTWRSFVSASDALATVIASGYFNDKINDWAVNDVLHIQATDGYGLYKVTSVTTNVTVEAYDIPEGNLDLAYGSVFVGDASAKAVALDASTDTQILVGNGTTVTSVALSSDVTMTNAGIVTIANDAVTTVKILDANVTKAKLATGVKPSHMIVYAGEHTTVGGAAAEAITVTGALATDLVFCQLHTVGASPQTILTAVASTDTVTATFSANPSSDHVITYQVVRATS